MLMAIGRAEQSAKEGSSFEGGYCTATPLSVLQSSLCLAPAVFFDQEWHCVPSSGTKHECTSLDLQSGSVYIIIIYSVSWK